MDRRGGGAGEVRASWGPLILVSKHWADVGVRVHWEPDAGTERAIRCLGREDFIDGSLWVRRQGGERCQNCPAWINLGGGGCTGAWMSCWR